VFSRDAGLVQGTVELLVQATGWERLSGAVIRAVTATELPDGAAG
jgi:hypothetical protein